MKKVLVIFGTRPEAIKMCPLVLELKKSEKLETLVCVTGQHREMLKQVLDIFKVVPDYDMAIMKKGQDLTDVTTAILTGMREILKKEKPDIVLVHGDTSTAFAASLAAFYQQIPVGHVEAGLRTYNMKSPYPEETSPLFRSFPDHMCQLPPACTGHVLSHIAVCRSSLRGKSPLPAIQKAHLPRKHPRRAGLRKLYIPRRRICRQHEEW